MNSVPKSARMLDLIFLVGVALFLCSIALGVFYSTDNRLQFPSVYDNYLEEGDLMFSKGDFARAAEHYRVASLINREDPLALIRLGLCLELTRQKDAAKIAYQRAINLQLANESHFTPEHPSRKKKKRK